tara:strand:+ start:204 stop:572 length:369 start_codon:yes stop_codon:yes gene_type:complete
MGSQMMEILVWLWSLAIFSVFLGLLSSVLRGMFDGYMDWWEQKHLTNPVDEDDPFNDPDVLDFLEHADKQGPWDEEDDKLYTIGGLTADKDEGFKKWTLKNKYKYEQSITTVHKDEEQEEKE